MEILKRLKNATLWEGRDAEGRRVYALTDNQDGSAVTPTSLPYCSQAAALAAGKERKPGPPRTASDANRRAQGNPPLLVRLPPEDLAWVRERGGANYVRGLIYGTRRREEMEGK